MREEPPDFVRCPIGLRGSREYVEHYQRERPRRGLRNEMIELAGRRPTSKTEARCEQRLGGLLRYYSRAA